MFVPYSVDVPMERMPLANWVLISVTTLISLGIITSTWRGDLRRDELKREIDPQTVKRLESAKDAADVERIVEEEIARRSAPPLALIPRYFSVVQLITHQFVHDGFIHLIGNMLFLFVFGNAVNAKLGHAVFLISYLLLGAIGGVAWLIFGNGLPMIGASGAIMGIVGIFVVLFPRNDVTILVFWRGGGSFELSAFWVVGIYFIFDLLGTINAGQGIAYVAHLAGEIFGMAVGIGLVVSGFVQSTRYEQNLVELLGWQRKPKPKKKGRTREDEL